jgi:hypothetical protein
VGALAADLRRALRSVRHRPALAAAVAATLALAIGANTAMFGVVHAVLLRPLPFPQPERIVRIEERHASGSTANLTGANVRALRERVASLSQVASYRLFPFNLSGESEPVAISAARVTPGFFGVLGARPLAGRRFAAKGLRLTLLGVAIGAPAAFLSGKALGALVHGVSGADPAALALASLVASIAGLATARLAARRAAALDPLAALRDE